MMPSEDAEPDLMEQAHLAFLRGQLAEAQTLLETLLARAPDDQAAQALLTQVRNRQDVQREQEDAVVPVTDPVTDLYLSLPRRYKRLAIGIAILAGLFIVVKVIPAVWVSQSLCDAARHGNYAGVRAWLARGAGADSVDYGTGETALTDAASTGSRPMVGLLLQRGADPNQRGRQGTTPLIEAAAAGAPDVVTDLLGAGAKVDAEDSNGRTALLFAAENGHLRTATILIAHHADVNHETPYYGSVLGTTHSSSPRSSQMTELLKQAGATR